MENKEVPTSQEIRTALIERASTYRRNSGVSFSRMSTDALKDNKFLANVQAGKNFTIGTYQRMLDWIDAQEAAALNSKPAK